MILTFRMQQGGFHSKTHLTISWKANKITNALDRGLKVSAKIFKKLKNYIFLGSKLTKPNSIK